MKNLIGVYCSDQKIIKINDEQTVRALEGSKELVFNINKKRNYKTLKKYWDLIRILSYNCDLNGKHGPPDAWDREMKILFLSYPYRTSTGEVVKVLDSKAYNNLDEHGMLEYYNNVMFYVNYVLGLSKDDLENMRKEYNRLTYNI